MKITCPCCNHEFEIDAVTLFMHQAFVEYSRSEPGQPKAVIETIDFPNIEDIVFKQDYSGLSVCLTGFHEGDKIKLRELSEKRGILLCETVSGKITVLVCGYNAGPAKIAKAKQLNKQVLEVKEFIEKYLINEVKQ